MNAHIASRRLSPPMGVLPNEMCVSRLRSPGILKCVCGKIISGVASGVARETSDECK
jgi:hypothetical protein